MRHVASGRRPLGCQRAAPRERVARGVPTAPAPFQLRRVGTVRAPASAEVIVGVALVRTADVALARGAGVRAGRGHPEIVGDYRVIGRARIGRTGDLPAHLVRPRGQPGTARPADGGAVGVHVGHPGPGAGTGIHDQRHELPLAGTSSGAGSVALRVRAVRRRPAGLMDGVGAGRQRLEFHAARAERRAVSLLQGTVPVCRGHGVRR